MGTCRSCGGSGKENCSNCGGRGYQNSWDSDKNCYTDQTCSRCGGTGRISCYSCGGSGDDGSSSSGSSSSSYTPSGGSSSRSSGSRYNGYGSYKLSNGNYYEGNLKNGFPHGKGKMTYANGNVYEGDFVSYGQSSKPQGKCKMTYANGDVYEGDWADHTKNGKGRLTHSDGTFEEGIWEDGTLIENKDIGYTPYIYTPPYQPSRTSSYTPSSSSSSYSSGNDVVPRGKFLSAVFGLVCGLGATLAVGWVIVNITGMAKLPAIPGIIMIIVGFIATFDSYRWKKNVVFLVLLALSVPGWLIMFRIIPEHVNLRQSIKSATTQTNKTLAITQQADITQNVNFRKGPSTNDEIIRQLKQGDTVTLTGEVSGGWSQITHNNETGWVSSEFLKVWGK